MTADLGAATVVRVKIDGVRSIAAARVAAEAGTDFIGLVLTESPRQLTTGAAGAIVAAFSSRREAASDATESRPPHDRLDAMLAVRRPLFVGVFGDESADAIALEAGDAGVDVVQLSGREAVAQLAAFWAMAVDLPVIVAFRPGLDSDGISVVPDAALTLLDSPHDSKLGGTGLRIDPAVAAACARRRPVMLAGGLTPENVAEAVRAIQPWGVDVSSGVETDGAKDHGKIRKFVAAARGAPAVG